MARVERWAEASGNAGLAGRESPAAQVLAADQRVTAWAKELKRAGVEGGMDALRARAYLDILLGMDSRPPGRTPGGAVACQDPAQPQAPDLAHPRRIRPLDHAIRAAICDRTDQVPDLRDTAGSGVGPRKQFDGCARSWHSDPPWVTSIW